MSPPDRRASSANGRRPGSPSISPWPRKKERNELLILLRKVKEFWVEGVLEHSVHGEALIDLGKEEWAEGEERPWEQILELPDQTSRTLPPGQSIGDLFDEVGLSLLILGTPGSGKTITLLDLARDLIARAETDPVQPIPVVFNLSAWTDPRQPLFDWLIEELKAKYLVPKKIGRSWLEKNWLLPMLDGLDEVKRENRVACVEAVNAFVDAHGVPGLVVCSRLEEYTALPERLKPGGAICLQPLKPEQVKEYVARSGEALAGLHAALKQDQTLQTLAETPLMLDVMTLAYRDAPEEAVASEAGETIAGGRKRLFDTYIDRMFVCKGKVARPYTREQTVAWLAWLARSMQQHGQTVFLIEQLQPSWLPTRGQRWVYLLTSRLIGGLISGLIFWLIFWLIVGLNGGLIVGLNGGLIFGLIAAFWYGGMDVIQHYLLRFMLARNRYLPRKLAPFLDYAAKDLTFLRKVGGGYMFIHRYLLEHFAARGEASEVPETPAQPAEA